MCVYLEYVFIDFKGVLDPRLSLTFMQNTPTKTKEEERPRCNRRWMVTLSKRTKCLSPLS